MLSVANKPIMLSVAMLNVVAPDKNAFKKALVLCELQNALNNALPSFIHLLIEKN
jgi:hypothetical protein